MTAAVADQDGLLWLFVAFGLGAAMRHSEIVRVRFDDVDFGTRRIWIDKAEAGEREQPITPALADAIERQRDMSHDRDRYIFLRRARRSYRTGGTCGLVLSVQ